MTVTTAHFNRENKCKSNKITFVKESDAVVNSCLNYLESSTNRVRAELLAK